MAWGTQKAWYTSYSFCSFNKGEASLKSVWCLQNIKSLFLFILFIQNKDFCQTAHVTTQIFEILISQLFENVLHCNFISKVYNDHNKPLEEQGRDMPVQNMSEAWSPLMDKKNNFFVSTFILSKAKVVRYFW